MRPPARLLLLALPLVLTAVALDAQPPRDKATLELAADRTAYEVGAVARLAAVLTVESGWHVNSHQPTFDWLIPTSASLELPDGWPEARWSYPEGALKTFAFENEPLSVYDGEVILLAEVEIPAEGWEGGVPVTATVRYQACDDRSCLPPTTAVATLELAVGAAGQPVNSALFATETAGTAPPRRGIALLLLLGLVGGLILNAMPCVLPVLSLKLFGLVESASHGRARVVAGALATAAGIVISFWGLALAAVVARSAGATVGWGVQFQEPIFVVFLAVVVLLFCLNLWGLFEIPLPQRLARLGGGARQGLPGHFASGLFATLMATPCSAPFLGTAVGFALSQPAMTTFAIFTAVGLGMALPYLALAVSPRALRLIPAPGAWMVKLKVVMGFLLAGAAVWLLYVLAAQVSPERLAFVELALLVMALFVWLRSTAAGRIGRAVAAAGIVASLAAALLLAAGGERGLDAGERALAAPQRIAWVPFDRAEAVRLAAEGRPVFVDVTADWCFTCKVNERLVLETAEVEAAFERHGVVPMKADWTNRSDEIARFLSDHGRYGIPFYLLYRPGAKPHLFGELLTKGEVIERVASAAAGGDRVR